MDSHAWRKLFGYSGQRQSAANFGNSWILVVDRAGNVRLGIGSRSTGRVCPLWHRTHCIGRQGKVGTSFPSTIRVCTSMGVGRRVHICRSVLPFAFCGRVATSPILCGR
jgi:hypothetical protein